MNRKPAVVLVLLVLFLLVVGGFVYKLSTTRNRFTGWYEFGGSFYSLTPEALEWHEAENAARETGGHLVAIESAEENDWLVATFGGDTLFWIGLTDEAVEGTYRWTSGREMGYSNWSPGEPNDEYGREDYVFMNFAEPGLWNDLGPRSRRWGPYFGIVELPDE